MYEEQVLILFEHIYWYHRYTCRNLFNLKLLPADNSLRLFDALAMVISAKKSILIIVLNANAHYGYFASHVLGLLISFLLLILNRLQVITRESLLAAQVKPPLMFYLFVKLYLSWKD